MVQSAFCFKLSTKIMEKKNYLDLTNLIRSIQRAEKKIDCFRKAQEYCDRLDCPWRKYCLEEPEAIAFESDINRSRRDEKKLR